MIQRPVNMKTIILLLLVTTGVLSSCNSRYQVVLNDNVVYSPYNTAPRPSLVNDANLEGCLNQYFASSGNNDPENVTLLACPAAGVQSLAGIRALPNLEQLELSDNDISDLRPLQELKNLRVLSIRNNRITNINAILSLPILRFVALQGNDAISCRQLDTLEEKLGNTLSRPSSCAQ